MKTKDGVHFGKELREKEFLFDKDFLNLNHGTYTPFTHTLVFMVENLLEDSFNAMNRSGIPRYQSRSMPPIRRAKHESLLLV